MNVSAWFLRASVLIAMTALLLEVRGLRRPSVDAAPERGSALRGAVHLFTVGMLPHRKESATLHPVSFGAGVLFHVGAFVALGLLVAPLRWVWFAVPLVAGLCSSLYLLVRRLVSPGLRGMSSADDYLSTGLVSLLTASATARVLVQSPHLAALHNSLGAVLFLYMPVGKLRHWFYFLLSRGLFGSRLGRRGIVGA